MIRHALFLAVATSACGGGGSSSPDGAPGDAAASDGLSRCDATGPARALLAAISADDVVELFALEPGHLRKTGIRLTGITKPARIVMRDDGAEALVAWGGFGSPFGFARIEVAPDGSSAAVKQVRQVGTDSTPMSITYADHDHAVIALAGMQDEVLGLARSGSDFAPGTRVAAPADYPLQVRGRPATQEVLLSRSQVGIDSTLDIYRLRAQSDGTWKSSGPHAAVPGQPIAMALHPSGNALYVPTGDPANPVSSQNLDAPGLLHAVRIGTNDFTDAGSVQVPRVTTLLAADPGGHFVVADGNIYMKDGNGNPNVASYVWQTVKLAPDGALGEVFPATAPKDGLLFDDLEVAGNGTLVAARELYAGSVPPAEEYPLELWAQPTWGAWELCDTAYLTGGAQEIAISP